MSRSRDRWSSPVIYPPVARFPDFQGRTLKAGAVEYPPFYMKQHHKDGSFTRTGPMWKAGWLIYPLKSELCSSFICLESLDIIGLEFSKSINVNLKVVEWETDKAMIGKPNKPKLTYRSSQSGTGRWKTFFQGKVDFVLMYQANVWRYYQVSLR